MNDRRNLSAANGISFVLSLLTAWVSYGQGTIVHTVPPQPLYYGPNPSSQNIDINGDSVSDFTLFSDGNAITLAPLYNNAVAAWPEPPPDLGSLVWAFNLGNSISSSLDPVLIWYGRTTDQFGSALIVETMNAGSIGFFQGHTDAYVGFELNVGTSSYFGWLHFQNLGLNVGQVTDWACNSSPNMPIVAGQVPEPSTGVLIILAGGIVWLTRRRND
jgi:hypothetical protein